MTKKINFILNNENISIDENPAKVLLDFIRQEKNITGTKEVCREGDCGACAVLLGEVIDDKLVYKSVNSCLFPLGNVSNKHVVTIEGLNNKQLTPIQQAFVDEGATQCGFCTPGFIISLTGYLLTEKSKNYEDAINAIAGNICRCTGYASINRATNKIVNLVNSNIHEYNSLIESLIGNNILPTYFSTIENRLKEFVKNEIPDEIISEDDPIIVAGGTDLYVQKHEEIIDSEVKLLSAEISNKIKFDNKHCILGGRVTFEMMSQSEEINSYFPEFKNYSKLIASLPVRNSATIAGNIVNASPIGDMTIILLALNSIIILNEGHKKREIKLKELYKGYKNLDKSPAEIIELIKFHLPRGEYHFNFEKVSKRTHLDIASVNSAAYFETDNETIKKAHLSAGGVSPIPLYLTKGSKFLTGKSISFDTLDELLKIIQSEISPIDDVRGSAEYKRLLLSQLVKAHFIKLFPQKINFSDIA